MEDINNTEQNKETQEEREIRSSSREKEQKKSGQNSKGSALSSPWLWIFVIVIVAVGVVFGTDLVKTPSLNITNNGDPQNEQQQNENNGETAATVNGEKISQSQLEARMMQTQQSLGTSTDVSEEEMQTQALNSLINEALIMQEAENQGVTVSDEEVNNSYQTIEDRFDDESQFQQTLDEQGLTKEDLKENIRRELMTQKYLQNNINQEEVSVADEEIQQTYDQLSSQREGVPPLEEIKPQLKQQLQSQKQNQLIQQLIEQLRNNTDIQKNI